MNPANGDTQFNIDAPGGTWDWPELRDTSFFLRVANAGTNLMRINMARIKVWFYE